MQACGVIVLVQEQRFELLADDGARRHFTLAHDAPLDWNELTRLQQEGCRVAVWYAPAPAGRSSASVHAVARIEPAHAAAARA